jgi:hypothetical protein
MRDDRKPEHPQAGAARRFLLMASPLFLSYGWREGAPPEVAEKLDRALRLRGVPMWRDLRDLNAGSLNEEIAGTAIREDCCGCVLHCTEDVLDSWFIGNVELEAVRHRLDRDETFFVAVVFDEVSEEQITSLERRTGLNLRSYQGLFLDSVADLDAQIDCFAGELLRRYLTTLSPDEAVAKIDSWGQIPWGDPAPIQLNWTGEDGGQGLLPDEWGALKSAIADLRTALLSHSRQRLLHISGNVHLSAAFLIGWEFRETTGWTIAADHPRAPVTLAATPPDEQGWTLRILPSQNDSASIIVRVCASADCSRAVRTHRAEMNRARVELAIFPPDGEAGRFSVKEVDQNGLASAISASIRTSREKYEVNTTELYLACPWTLALSLGWNFASNGPLVVHEATADKGTYHPNPLRIP